jgi:hypothetical protein
MFTKPIGKDIFVEMNADFDSVDKFLDKYGIKIYWLFEDGVKFEYPDSLSVRYDPGDCSFVDTATGALILTYLENFGQLEFLNSDQEVIFSIRIND